MSDNMIKIIVEVWQEKRLSELHNCPDCKRWLQLHGGWQDATTIKEIPKKQNRIWCSNCKKRITVVLAGGWIKLWEKYWGFD